MADIPTYQRDYWLLAAILLLATVLRIVGLNAPLWYDEILTVDTHLRLPWREMMDGYSLNFHYLFNFQSKLAVAVFGEQNWAIRLPSMLFGVAGIAAIWVLARDLAGASIAHISALLLAISYHHIWFSQNARGYSELAFFSTLGMILFLRGTARPNKTLWLTYGFIFSLAVFTHLTGAFIFAAQGLVWVGVVAYRAVRGKMRPGLIRWPLIGYVVGGALTLLFYAPVLPSVLGAVGGVAGTSTVDVMVEYQNPLWTVLEGIRTALGATGALVGAVAVLVLGLSAVGAIALRKDAPLYAPVVALHIVLTAILLVTLGMRVWPRFFFADIGLLMILIVLGVRLISGWFGDKSRVVFATACVAMIAVSTVLATRNYLAPKQNLIGAFEFVEMTRAPDDTVYVAGHASLVFNGYFNAGWDELVDNADYAATLTKPGPAIFVVAFPARTLRKISDLDAATEGTLTLVHRFAGTLGDGNILIFRRE